MDEDAYHGKGLRSVHVEIRRALESGAYKHAIILTYNVDQEALQWLLDLACSIRSCYLVVGKKEDVAALEQNRFKNVVFLQEEVHGKAWLLWNKDTIECWLGSFNLSSSGLFDSIEWASHFTDKIIPGTYLDARMIVERKDFSLELLTRMTSNPIIKLCLLMVHGTIHSIHHEIFDNIIAQGRGIALTYHSSMTDAMTRSIRQLIEGRGVTNLQIQYFTPFMNKSGVECFSALFPNVLRGDISWIIFTNKPEVHRHTTQNYLNSQAIEDLKNSFCEFSFKFKNSGSDGLKLPDGLSISPEFMHMKLIHLVATLENGTTTRYTIFTSANLTRSAWKDKHRMEAGIVIYDVDMNEEMSRFIDAFEKCFSHASLREINAIDTTLNRGDKAQHTGAYWLKDYLNHGWNFVGNLLTIDLDDHGPDLDGISCTVYYDDVVLDETRSVSQHMEKNGNHFKTRLEFLESQRLYKVKFLSLDVTTRWSEPDIWVKKGHEENVRAFRPVSKVIDEGKKIIRRTIVDKTQTIRVGFGIGDEHQPIKRKRLVNDSSMVLSHIPGVNGRFLAITVSYTVLDGLTHDLITFLDVYGNDVDYLAFHVVNREDSGEGNIIRYYFQENELKGGATIVLKEPLNLFFKEAIYKVNVRMDPAQLPPNQDSDALEGIFSLPPTHIIPGTTFKYTRNVSDFISLGIPIQIVAGQEKPQEWMREYCFRKVKWRYTPFTRLSNPVLIADEVYSRVEYWVEYKRENVEEGCLFLKSKKSAFVVKEQAWMKEHDIDNVFRPRFSELPTKVRLSRGMGNNEIGGLLIDTSVFKEIGMCADITKAITITRILIEQNRREQIMNCTFKIKQDKDKEHEISIPLHERDINKLFLYSIDIAFQDMFRSHVRIGFIVHLKDKNGKLYVQFRPARMKISGANRVSWEFENKSTFPISYEWVGN